MRRLTALLNMLTTLALLWALYTGLDTITHKSTDPVFHGSIAFFAIFIASIATANSMMYINTLHKEIDELKSEKNKAVNLSTTKEG